MFLIVAGVGIIFLSHKNQFEQIRKNKGLTVGLIIDNKPFKGGNASFVYEYYLEGQRYTNETPFGSACTEFNRAVIGKTFPVVYEGGNPQNSQVLITEKSFARFDMKQPDTLKWVNSYCE